MVDFSGIQAHAQPIRHHFRDEAADGPGGLVFRGQGVPVGHEVVALIIFLEAHPVVERPVIVPQVHFAGGAHAAQDALLLEAEDFVPGPGLSSNAMLIPILKSFCHWWHGLSSRCGRRLKPAATRYEAYAAILTQAPIFWPKTFPSAVPFCKWVPQYSPGLRKPMPRPPGKGEQSRSSYVIPEFGLTHLRQQEKNSIVIITC